MELLELVLTSAAVAATRARGEKQAALAALLRRLAQDEVEIAIGFLEGAPRQGRIGVGWRALESARAAPAASNASLSLRDVDLALDAFAALRGPGSAARREQALAILFASATAREQDFLTRLLLGELRQGALQGVLLEAVAKAAEIPAAQLRAAAMRAGSLRAVAGAALASGAAGLTRFALRVMTPLQPMLAQTADDVCDALARLGRAAFEWKLDGARVQLHREGDAVRVFTRRGNDVTAAVPELVERALALPVRAAVFDGEAIALRADGRPHPFQVTMRRFGRRLDVEALRRELPLSMQLFDCLHLDGTDWLDRPARERFDALAACVPESLRVTRRVTDEFAEAEAFFESALAAGHEGLMAKSLDTPYEAGRRGAGWLKVKRVATLDLVVLAVEWGTGRRQGWLSNLHLGARDPVSGGFVMLGKTFKGLTDAMLAWQTEELQRLAVSQEGPVVHVRPELVVEVAFDGVQASLYYPGGVALRFARVKAHRPDKRAEEADTIETVRSIFARSHESEAVES
ncbi:MAG TPA: ATP-dependent DNA ligase [Myxococcota bacterium]|nr:ATP-dependent DNA ligase [Myxococcota bacterium]